MTSANLVDIFEDCINRIAAGQTIADCLQIYPDYAELLGPMLATSQRVRDLQIPEALLLEEQQLIWQRIEQQLPNSPHKRRRYGPPFQLLVAVFLLLGLVSTMLFVLSQSKPQPEENEGVVPLAETSILTAIPPHTITPTFSPTPTLTMTSSQTPTATSSPTATPSLTPTESPSPTWTDTSTPRATRIPSATFAPGCGAPQTAEDVIMRVLEIYPNTTITHLEQVEKFGDTLVWEVQTSHQIEVNIDVACGYILTIERPDDDDNSSAENANRNAQLDNGNSDISVDGSAPNFGIDRNSGVNDNTGNESANTNSNANDNEEDGDSGMGSGGDENDNEADDNSGMG